MNRSRDKTVIIVLGPTGVGKTGFSIFLAKALKTEIISADSMLVYRNMDIGTAKPSKDELQAVPHHLIDILSPDESFSAGLFKEKATEIIDKVHRNNKIPLVVGGTGLYIRALTKGLFKGPGADEALRRKLREEEERRGKGYLYKRLCTIDPDAARKIEPNDLRRIVRALEVSLKEKKGISEVRHVMTRPPRYDFIKIGLSRDREELYRIIEERVDKMMKDGLLQEARHFLNMKPTRTALQALGYKEMALYFEGAIDLEEAIRLIKKRTKAFAKRQYTWFRRERDVQWVDITGFRETDKIHDRVMKEVEILKKLIYSM